MDQGLLMESAPLSQRGGLGIIQHPPTKQQNSLESEQQSSVDSNDISLTCNSSYVKIPPVDSFLASLSNTSSYVSPRTKSENQ
jgi:hypothetical protein